MTFTQLILSPFTAQWPLWVMVFLMVVFVCANVMRPKILRAAWQISFSSTNRVYNDTSIMWSNSIDMRLFCIVVFGLSLQLLTYAEGPFRFTRFLLILVCVEAWVWLRRGIQKGMETLFKLKNKGFPMSFFLGLALIICSLLYVVDLIYILWGWSIVLFSVGGIVLLLWLGVIGVKLFRFFVRDWKSFLVFLTYWVVVEAGSLFGLYELIMVL